MRSTQTACRAEARRAKADRGSNRRPIRLNPMRDKPARFRQISNELKQRCGGEMGDKFSFPAPPQTAPIHSRMTSASNTIEEEIHLAPSQLWMLPLLLWRMICAWFAGEAEFLSQARSQGATVETWEDHLLDLAIAEWNISALLSESSRRLLAGEPLDYRFIRISPMPADWRPAVVEDSQHLLQRFEAVARFHADPEAAIRAHAADILLAATSPLRLPASPASTSPGLRPVEANASIIVLICRSDCLPMSRSDRGRWRPRTCAADGGGWRGMRKCIPP